MMELGHLTVTEFSDSNTMISVGLGTYDQFSLCSAKIKPKMSIKPSIILDNLSETLSSMGVEVVRPIYTDQRVCTSRWTRDSSYHLAGKSLYLPGHSKGRVNEWTTIKAALQAHLLNKPMVSPVKLEGGDIITDELNKRLLVGIGKRTNITGAAWLKTLFPTWTVVPISHTALHLDCVLGLLPGNVLLWSNQYISALPHFSQYQVYEIYQLPGCSKLIETNLATNWIVNRDNTVITTDQPEFRAVRKWIKRQGFTVKEIKFGNLWKMGGGIRCLTQWVEPNSSVF